MVFMKKLNKGGKPNQKVQGKKPFQKEAIIDMSDDDFDDDMDSDADSDDAAVVTKTPKGRQSLNEKRVSFQVPGGKNTPAKTPVGKKQATPAKDNSVSKKQATPGKAGLQKFKGMEQLNQKSKKGSQPADEDDDDDDDDDDEDDDSDADLDLIMGGGDDDDDDDDDDEDDDDEDDEDDDDDDDEEEEEIQKNSQKGKNQKQNVVQAKQTPSKGNEKMNALSPKGAQTPKAAQTPKSKDNQTPKKENNAVSPKLDAFATQEEERRKRRDAKQLYLGNLPTETTAEELKALSSDILSVSIPTRPNMNHSFAFLTFDSEEKAEENFKTLKAKTFKGSSLTVDYVGFKSARQSKNAHQAQYNPKKLFVSGLPLDVTVLQVAKFFPKSHTVSLNQSASYRTATVSFWTEEDGSAAFEESKDIDIKGVKLSVLHSRIAKSVSSKRKRTAQKKNRNKKNNSGPPGKKMKFMKKEESDDE